MAAAKEGSKKSGKKGSKQPYFSLSNEEGVLGLALLQAKLAQEEGGCDDGISDLHTPHVLS